MTLMSTVIICKKNISPFSTENGNYKLINKISDKEFNEWFVELCDVESNFTVYIRKDKKAGINFYFKIELHVDDIQILHLIK